MSLIQDWANNIGVTEPLNGSWINAIAEAYRAIRVNDNILLDIAIKLRANNLNGNLYQSIAIKLSNNQGIQPLNGSWLARIVELTS
jgi:hypothetical protein